MNQRDEFTQFLDGESAVGIEKAIVSYLHKPPGQYMLQEPSDKLHGLQCHGLPCVSLTVFIGKCNGIIFNARNAVIGNSHTKDIP